MEKSRNGKGAHCLVLPYPIQGHMNPMLQFSKRLQHKGLKVTLATTRFVFKTMQKPSGSIPVETISDGFDEGGRAQAESHEVYRSRFQQIGSQTLEDLVKKLSQLGCPVDCIVYDAFIPWVLDVAKRLGLFGAVFFTQSCAVDTIYYYVNRGLLKVPLTESEVLIEGLPPLEPADTPSFIHDPMALPGVTDWLVNQLSNVEEADCVLCNTIYELEKEVVDSMAKLCPFTTIGPAIPSMYLDKRLESDTEYGLDIFKPDTDACIKWLNKCADGSVVYVSFGSLTILGVEGMEELAMGLKGSGKSFLWVVRALEEAKLPKSFIEETSKQGLVVSWCPQLKVLAHRALGCFVTHCGWNSTLEALSLGVPMVSMPQWTDQSTNSKFVVDVWKTGIRAKPDDKGIVRKEVVEKCIREVMEGEAGEVIKQNAGKWRDLAREAVDEGGSSDRHIDDFVGKLIHS